MTATLLIQIAARTTLVFLAGWALTRLMRRASAASRHLVWVLVLAAGVGVPAMHLAGPAWTLAVLPSPEPIAAQTTLTPPLGVEPVDAVEANSASMAVEPAAVSAPAATATPVGTPDVGRVTRVAAWMATNWGAVVVGLWALGAVLMSLRLLVGVVWASLMVRRADEMMDTAWSDALDEASTLVNLRRAVGLRISPAVRVPMATGLWRAVVLLPPAAFDWPLARRRVVLQHELAHVKRRDCLMQALAQVVCAVHWFNPLAHVAVARLRAEQERACDDLVLQGGTDAHSYADELLESARSFRAAPFPTWVAMSMARPSQLEERMLAILDSARTRRVPSVLTRASLAAAMVLLVVPVGTLRLAAQQPGVDPTSLATTEPVFDGSDLVHTAKTMATSVVIPWDAVRSAEFEVVRGQATDLDLLETAPLTAFGDIVLAGGLLEAPGTVGRSAAVTKTETRPRSVSAQAQAQASTVSDETRRKVADALTSALADDNPQVRQEALTALASMRDERAVPGLVRALNDSTVDVRRRAVSALAQFSTPAAADGLVTALKDRNADVRRQAAASLTSLIGRGQLRDAKYVDALTALVRDEDPDVRQQAVGMLGRMRQPAALAPLTQALRDSSADVREQAARGLGELGNADAVPALIPMLKDAAIEVREQAARSLGALADPRAIDALTAALKDTDAGVREEVARALGQIARGERRRVRPGVPTPPIPPLPPRAMAIDQDRLREITERAQAAAERAQRDVEERMRNFDFRFDLFDLPFALPAPVPLPAPQAVPAPPAPPAPR